MTVAARAPPNTNKNAYKSRINRTQRGIFRKLKYSPNVEFVKQCHDFNLICYKDRHLVQWLGHQLERPYSKSEGVVQLVSSPASR